MTLFYNMSKKRIVNYKEIAKKMETMEDGDWPSFLEQAERNGARCLSTVSAPRPG